jgi:CrcB protein
MITWMAIAGGAALGALGRWRLGLWLNHGGAWLPWGTLAANWIGAYAIGWAVVWFQQQPGLDPVWRLALITGVLGALTTFSTFSLETVELLQQERWGTALSGVALHLLGSLGLTWLGMRHASAWLA